MRDLFSNKLDLFVLVLEIGRDTENDFRGSIFVEGSKSVSQWKYRAGWLIISSPGFTKLNWEDLEWDGNHFEEEVFLIPHVLINSIIVLVELNVQERYVVEVFGMIASMIDWMMVRKDGCFAQLFLNAIRTPIPSWLPKLPTGILPCPLLIPCFIDRVDRVPQTLLRPNTVSYYIILSSIYA